MREARQKNEGGGESCIFVANVYVNKTIGALYDAKNHSIFTTNSKVLGEDARCRPLQVGSLTRVRVYGRWVGAGPERRAAVESVTGD